MSDLEALCAAGLSNIEAQVYLSLLESGPGLVGPVIKKTGLHRASVYQTLQRLKEKGLVSSLIRGKKQNFQATPPQRIVDELGDKVLEMRKAMPSLLGRMEKQKEKQDVIVYQGVKGIRSALTQMLEEVGENGRYCDFGVSGLFRSVMGPYWEAWQEQKKIKKIRSQVIFNQEIKRKNPGLLAGYEGEFKFHPPEYSSLTDTMIYNDTVMLIIWTSKPPVAVVIKNSENAQSYLNQFNLMWKHASR